ncbi:MAG: hypothetical protein HRT47_08575 [Candidatus Caenarcaniphilales bacterium]|nr:hypothetical protein [Candidatus Caenarcaniphilales bacterium]
MRLTLALLVLIIAQSCSSIKSSTKESAKAPTKAGEHAAKTVESRFKEGDKLKSYFNGVKVQTLEGEKKKLNQFFKKENNNILIAVKPHCIFCETFLASLVSNIKNKEILKSGKKLGNDTPQPVDINSNIIFFTDAKHSSLEEFKAKANDFKDFSATWVYDYNNKLSNDFAVTAFPRFLVLDSGFKLTTDKRGLVAPENPEELRGLEVPVVLRKICETTVAWLADK